MVVRIKAVYRDGAFIPDTPCVLPQNTHVELTVETPSLVPPTINDPEERKRQRHELVEQMKSRSISTNAPTKLTRDEMHERR